MGVREDRCRIRKKEQMGRKGGGRERYVREKNIERKEGETK